MNHSAKLFLVLVLAAASPCWADAYTHAVQTYHRRSGPIEARSRALGEIAASDHPDKITFLAGVVDDAQADYGLRHRALALLAADGGAPARGHVLLLAQGEPSHTEDGSLIHTAFNYAARFADPLPAPDLFVRALDDRSRSWQALKALARYGEAGVAEALAAFTTRCEPHFRDAVELSLCQAVQAGLAKPAGDEDDVRPWLLERALAAPPPWPELVPALLPLAAGCEGAGAVLAPLTRAGSEVVRYAAIEALGRVADPTPDAVAALADRCGPAERSVLVRAEALVSLTRAGANDHVRAQALDAAADRDPALAVAGLTALIGRDDPQALAAAAAGLRVRKQPRLAWAALTVLHTSRQREAIPSLIDGLRTWKDGPVRRAILRALEELTGQQLGDRVAAWRRWWSDDRAAFVVPPPVTATAAPELPPWKTRTRAPQVTDPGGSTFYGIPITQAGVAFVIDCSGSMDVEQVVWVTADRSLTGDPGSHAHDPRLREVRASRLEICQAELTAAVDALPETTRVNVWSFKTSFDAWKDAPELADGSTKRKLLRHVDRFKPGGSTNLFDPLQAALLDPDVEAIYILSDGAPNEGEFTEPDAILRAVRHLNTVRNVTIHCVGVGVYLPFLRRLAAENGGSYVER